jgi:hypothetical protein
MPAHPTTVTSTMPAQPTSPASLLAAFHNLSCDALVQAAAAVDSSLSCIRDLATCEPAVVSLPAPAAATQRIQTVRKARPLRVVALAKSHSLPTPETPRAALVRSSSNKSLPHERPHRPPPLQLASLTTKKQKVAVVAPHTAIVMDTPMTRQVKSHLDDMALRAGHLSHVPDAFMPKKPAAVAQRKPRPTGCSARFRHATVVQSVVFSPKGRRAAGGRWTPRHGSALI